MFLKKCVHRKKSQSCFWLFSKYSLPGNTADVHGSCHENSQHYEKYNHTVDGHDSWTGSCSTNTVIRLGDLLRCSDVRHDTTAAGIHLRKA